MSKMNFKTAFPDVDCKDVQSICCLMGFGCTEENYENLKITKNRFRTNPIKKVIRI